jgi:hypothetical protein
LQGPKIFLKEIGIDLEDQILKLHRSIINLRQKDTQIDNFNRKAICL